MEGSYKRKLKIFVRDDMLELSAIGLIISSIGFIMGIIGVFLPQYDVPIISAFLEKIGYWDYWLFIASLIFTGLFAWFLYSNITDRLKFNELIDTKSKSIFVKNQDELEEIAYRLGTKFQDELFDKKRELKVK